MLIAIATFEGMPPEFRDDELLLERLSEHGAEIDYRPWDDPNYDWSAADLVVARSPWDYSGRREEFVAWAERIGERLENSPAVLRWNSDKRYLADLAESGIPVVETRYVAPGQAPPPIEGEVVIKPAISAGARDTGRFGPVSAEEGRKLVERITGSGGTAMVQPFLESVEERGETAVVTFSGGVSHVLRKRPVLRADEVAPVREDALGVAEAMYDPELVVSGSASEAELALVRRLLGFTAERFGRAPLTARVDMLAGAGGDPVVLELEAIEPNLYFDREPEAAERLARAIIARTRELDDASASRG